MKNWMMAGLMLCIGLAEAGAQAPTMEAYKAQAEVMRSKVWAWNQPAFQVRTIPDAYAKSSKVIIARHTELDAESKTRPVFMGLGVGVTKTQQMQRVFREIVKLNDKAAVEEYSQLSITAIRRMSGFQVKNNSATYFGIRIYKPGGKVVDYKGDDMVLTENTDWTKKAKLAIPDLAPGDVLDYFISTTQDVSSDFQDEDYSVYLFDDAPIMHLSFHGTLGEKYALQYRSYNGAPELNVSKNENQEILMTTEADNIPAYSNQVWLSPGRQLPFIRIHVALGVRSVGVMGTEGVNGRKPGTITRNTPPDEVMAKAVRTYSAAYVSHLHSTPIKWAREDSYNAVMRSAKALDKRWKSLSMDEKAELAYYANRKTLVEAMGKNRQDVLGFASTGRNYNKNGIDLLMLFRDLDMDPGIAILTRADGVKEEEVLEFNDFMGVAYLPENSNKLYAFTDIFSPFQYGFNELEGSTKAYEVKFKKVIGDPINAHRFAVATPSTALPMPAVAGPADNSHKDQLIVSLKPDASLQVSRITTLKGRFKEDAQQNLITYQEFIDADRKVLGDKGSYLEMLAEGGKKTRYLLDEITLAYEEGRKVQKQNFETDVKNWFELEVSNFANPKVINLGTHHSAPDFVYSSSFQLDGLVKKAGSNMIVEVGRLQGTPLQLRNDQRNRNGLDVYMPFARTFEYAITFEVPEGYSASGVEALNKSVVNKAGEFTTKATMSGRTVTINIKKQYSHRFEPAVNWSDLLAIIDASNEFSAAKLLIKKS